MRGKKLILISGVILLLFLCSFLILNLLKPKSETIIENTENNIENTENNIETYNSNIIKNVNYTSTDIKGNTYSINAEIGEIDIDNSSVIFLTNVKAIIKLQNSEKIEIFSNFGNIISTITILFFLKMLK